MTKSRLRSLVIASSLAATISLLSQAAGQEALEPNGDRERETWLAWPALVPEPTSLVAVFHYTLASSTVAVDLDGWHHTEPAPWSEPAARSSRATQGNWTAPTLHALGLMSAMRLSAAVIWPEPFAQTDPSVWLDNYGRALREEPKWDSSLPAFEWDGDPWPINVVGHGLFGSELYLRPRICGKSPLAAALFTAGAGATWEYVFEGNAVQPSGLDLWFTPLAGAVLGELRFHVYRAASALEDPVWRGVLQTLFDPLGQVERALGAPS
jgi:hypothetical protein